MDGNQIPNQNVSNVNQTSNTVPNQVPSQTSANLVNNAGVNQAPNQTVSNVNPVNASSNVGTQTNTGNVLNNVNDNIIPEPKKKKKHGFVLFLLLVIALLGGYCYFIDNNYKNYIQKLKYKCTPISSYDEDKELDLDSVLVQNLYSKVYTNVKEDYAQPEWDNTMKLYLAYRQVLEKDKYHTTCDKYDNSKMEPYSCNETDTFTPLAFKKSVFVLEYKKLFGEESTIIFDNIKLLNSCIGGYQYIEEREEFVQGLCTEQSAVSIKADKKLVSAVSNGNTIVLTEDVKYRGDETLNVPSYMKNGTYIYTFKLDINYNYVLVSRIYDSKY